MSNPIIDLKSELMAAAERQIRHAPAPERPRRFSWRVVAMRPLLVAATIAVAAAAALFLTTPWSSSPSFLARAQAAVTPREGMILHAKWVTSRYPQCAGARTGEIWIDGAYSEKLGGHRFRTLRRDPYLPYPFHYFTLKEISGLDCAPGSAYEVGGVVDVGEPLRFVPPNRLVRQPGSLNPAVELDPVADLRRQIRAGRACDEGETTLHGRTVERIRLERCPGLAYSKWRPYVYVDPDTFYPVEINQPEGYIPFYGGARNVTRFTVLEYLPRTAASLALTSIRAQHPHASGP